MKKTAFLYVSILVIAIFLAGCAGSPDPAPPETAPVDPVAEPEETVEPAPESSVEESAEETDSTAPMSDTEAPVTLRPATGSFSPEHGDHQRFFVDGAAGQPIDSWEFGVTDQTGALVFQTGESGTPPEVIEWDGTTDDAAAAEEGAYAGTLIVRYEDGSERNIAANPFLIDTTDPLPSFTLAGVPFTPDGDGVRDDLIITIDAQDASPIAAWLFEIQTLDGRTLASYSDTSDVPRTARWNGRPGGGYIVESGDEFRIVGGVRDEAGNEGRAEVSFVVGFLTEQYRGRSRIVIPSIQFPANSARIQDASPAAQQKFNEVVDRTARILAGTEERILIEGHANSTRFSAGRADPAEQTRELIPLSRDRAAVVRRALIERGIAPGRLEIDGVGAADPIASFSDPTGRVRNRRIEFYVIP